MLDWHVPGLALAIVKGTSILHARGFGTREVAQTYPVDEHTLFAIGSNAKAVTAAALGLLVQEGKLSWDDEIIEHLPTFQLPDPYATEHLSIRDILSHRSGFGGGELLTLTDYNREDILSRIQYLGPNQSFRNGLAYSNILYLAAGEVVRSVTGGSWEQFVQDRILRPLGMDRTVVRAQDLEQLDNVASPHIRFDGVLTPIPYHEGENVAPAEGVFSTAADMAEWLTMFVQEGQSHGVALLDTTIVRELRAPQAIVRSDLSPGAFPSAHLAASGLGWFLQDYHDRLVVWHTGNVAGMGSTVGFLPEDDVGVVVLTNTFLNDLHRAVFWRAIDACLNRPRRDWSAEFRRQWTDPSVWVSRREEELRGKQIESPEMSVSPQRLIGVYDHNAYGEVVIRLEEDHLALAYGGTFEGDLEAWYDDAFRITWRDPVLRGLVGSGVALFSVGSEGIVGRLSMDLGLFGAYEFERR